MTYTVMEFKAKYGSIEMVNKINAGGKRRFTSLGLWIQHFLVQMIISKKMKENKMDGSNRSDIDPGLKVKIVLKKDQRSGNLTEGVVKDILTKSSFHPHGIKVRLKSGEVGRVKEIFE